MLDYLEQNLTCPECKKKTLKKELIEYKDEDGSTWADFSYSYYYLCDNCGYFYETEYED